MEGERVARGKHLLERHRGSSLRETSVRGSLRDRVVPQVRNSSAGCESKGCESTRKPIRAQSVLQFHGVWLIRNKDLTSQCRIRKRNRDSVILWMNEAAGISHYGWDQRLSSIRPAPCILFVNTVNICQYPRQLGSYCIPPRFKLNTGVPRFRGGF